MPSRSSRSRPSFLHFLKRADRLRFPYRHGHPLGPLIGGTLPSSPAEAGRRAPVVALGCRLRALVSDGRAAEAELDPGGAPQDARRLGRVLRRLRLHAPVLRRARGRAAGRLPDLRAARCATSARPAAPGSRPPSSSSARSAARRCARPSSSAARSGSPAGERSATSRRAGRTAGLTLRGRSATGWRQANGSSSGACFGTLVNPR